MHSTLPSHSINGYQDGCLDTLISILLAAFPLLFEVTVNVWHIMVPYLTYEMLSQASVLCRNTAKIPPELCICVNMVLR